MAAGLPDTIDVKVKDISVQAAKKQQESYEEFSKEVNGLKGSQPNEAKCKAKLEAKKEEMKRKAANTIDQSFYTATKYIDTLPKAQQGDAASVFSNGADLVIKAALYIYDKCREIISAVVEFLKGIWDKGAVVYNAVKDFVSNIVGSITRVFFMPGLAAPVAANSGLYEGSVICRQSVSLTEGAANFERIYGYLSLAIENAEGPKPEYTVVSKSIHISEGECTAKILFKVTEHAPKLGQYFKNFVAGYKTTSWTFRGE